MVVFGGSVVGVVVAVGTGIEVLVVVSGSVVGTEVSTDTGIVI